MQIEYNVYTYAYHVVKLGHTCDCGAVAEKKLCIPSQCIIKDNNTGSRHSVRTYIHTLYMGMLQKL